MGSEADNFQLDLAAAEAINNQEANSKPILTYGSLIYLTFSEENLTEYYAYSEGLTKTKVLLKTKESFHREGSYMRGLFRIYPSFYQNEYAKGKELFEEIISAGASQLNKRETRAQIPKMIKGISEELALNRDVYEKMKGSPVRYGQMIQLLHVGSQKYLSYDPESPSDLENDCLQIELKYENSEYTCFRIQPSFKYQQESQGYIYNDDIVYLMSVVDSGNRIFGDPYLHASRTIGTLNEENPNQENLEKKEINVSNDKKTPWRIKIFSDYISDKIGVLAVGDIIWINLSEEDKNLIVQTSNDKESNYSFKFVLCSSSDRYKKFVGNSNGMFIIEGLSMARGGLVKWNSFYRLKHLTTNKYLSVGSQPAWDIDERKDNGIHTFKLANSEKEAANFSFEIIYSTISSRNKQFFMKYVPKDAYFKLRVNKDLWVTYRDVARDLLDSKEQYQEDFVTLPLIGKIKENNIFHCSQASQNQVIVTMFLISCKNTIKNTLKYLDPEFMSYSESEFQQLQLKHKVVTNQLDRMKTCLRQLELFCNNKLIDYLSADQSYGKINPFIQNLLKEQLFIELLAYTLIVCFPKHQYLEELKKTEKARKDRKAKKERENLLSMGDSVAITPRNKGFHDDVIILPNQAEVNSYTSEINEDINHRKKRICELSYQLIIAVCQDNIANKNYAFQYLPLFQMQAEYIPNSVDCVNMILKDNEEVLLNLHKNNATFQDHITLTSYTNNMITGASEALGKLTTNPRQESFNQKSQRLGKDVPGLRAQKRKSSSLIIANSSALAEDSYAYAYLKYYNRISKYFQSELPKVLKDWEPIKFFAALLQKTEDVEKQKKLIFFFKTISLHAGEGININQEIIHKYFTSAENASGNILSSNLVRVFTHEGKRLCVKIPFAPYKDKVYDLREFLATDDGAAEYNPTLMNSIDDSSMNMDYEMEIFDRVERRNQEILTKHLDLCAALCQSRNYSWKHILEKEITWESLLSQLVEELPSDVKASLSRLMTSLYIDQEPRREAAIPLFCKIVDKKKLVMMENRKDDGHELLTMATGKTGDFAENSTEANIDSFKIQLLSQIENLENVMGQLPLELKKDNILFFERKIEENWNKAYNSYILEVLQTTFLMLKFNKIKIFAKKIHLQPLPKENDIMNLNKKGKKKGNFKLNNFMNIFNSAKTIMQPGEFEHIMRSLIMLVEYDRTYPEAKKMLKEIRDAKNLKKTQATHVLSAKNLFNKAKGIAAKTKQLIMEGKISEKNSKKQGTDLDFLEQELTTNELYLKQGDVMKKILENLLGQQELDIETNIKMKILDMLEYFFEYKQDKLFSNVRRVFFTLVNEAELLKIYRENTKGIEAVRQRIQEILGHYMKYIVPRILLTGTSIDETDNIFKMDNGDDILDLNDCLDFEVLPMLFQQLCLTSNPLYERKLLHLMTRMYNQRNEFSESVKNLLLLFEDKNIQNYNKAKKLAKILQKYTEESESWLTSTKVDEAKLETTKEVLLFFYNSIFLTDIEEEEDDKQQQGLDLGLLSTKPVNKTRQDMHRHLKIYVPVISLIKDNIHIVESVKSQGILDLFRLCFAFLTAFVKQNESNQQILSNSIVVFLYNMSSNLGHVQLLNELFRDNYAICTSKAEEVIDDFFRLILANGRRAEYLEFFKIIQNVGGEMVYPNQRMVLNMFLDPKNRNLLLYLDQPIAGSPKKRQPKTEAIIDKKSFANTFSFEKVIQSKIYSASDEPYFYHAKLLELLGLTACGKEGLILNEVRLRSTIDFSYLLELLLEEDDFTSDGPTHKIVERSLPNLHGILKIPILEYIFYVYVESEKTSLEPTKGTKTIRDVVAKEKNRIQNLQHYNDTYLKYLFDNLLLILHWFFKQSRENQTEGRGEELKRDYTELLHFLETLLSNLNKFDALKISQVGKQNLHNLLSFCQKDKDLGEFDRVVKQELKKKDPKIIEKTQSKKDLTEAEMWKNTWEQFVDVFLNSKLLEEEIDKERKIFAKSLTQIDKLFRKDAVVRELVNNEEVTKKFINFIINNESNDDTRDTMVLILNALGNLIENEEGDEKVVEKQNFLNRLNAVYMIFSKLSDPNLDSNDEVFKELILFAIKLLEGGNVDVQKSVYSYFTRFDNSEMFFYKLHDKFHQELQNVKKLQENPQSKVEDDSDDVQNILRLLQLFAEGHFSDLQNYIRQQTNSYHNYDLLDEISDLLNEYMEAKHTSYFDTMIQCFDTITEFIQGPCVENQNSIIQGSFLDLAASLLAKDEVAEGLIRKSQGKTLHETELKKWQLARLKHKCSITLMSLLEARQDTKNIFRMMKSLPVEALKMNICDIYHMFTEQYKGQYSNKVFLHFNHDPDEEHSEEYCSLIIETGFNLYFLLNIFSEAKPSDEDEEFEREMEEREREEQAKNKSNIFIKWGRFLNLLLDISVQGVKKISQRFSKNNAEKNKKTRKDLYMNMVDSASPRAQESIITMQLSQEREKIWKEAAIFFKKNSANIEVVREDNNLEKTYFYLPPFCTAITKDTKTDFKNKVNRTSSKTKCSDLLNHADDLIETIKYEYDLQTLFNRITILSILTKNILLWRDTAFLFAIIINFIVLVSYQRNDTDYGYHSSVPNTIINFGSVLIVLSLFIVAYFMIKTAPLLVRKAWKDMPEKPTFFTYVVNCVRSVIYLLSDFYVLYYCCYGISAIIGVAYTPFFFAVHLLDVLVRFPLLQSVLKAIWIPRKSLLLTFLLFQLLNYVFSLYGYYFYYDEYQGYCSSTWSCFLTSIDKSFKVDGGIGGFLSDNVSVKFGRFAFDNLYNLLVMIIMINIVSGIIIDNFGTLREEEKEFRDDVQNICFICGNDRELLEKASDAKGKIGGTGFATHIKKEHYLWNYLFYIAYIKDKDKTEYTGLESYIAEQIEEGDISWFPTDKALILQDFVASDDNNSGLESLRKIQEEQKNLLKEVSTLSKNIHNMDDLVKKYEIKKLNASSKQPTIRSFSSGAVNLFEGQAPVSKILGDRSKPNVRSPGRSSIIKSNISDMDDDIDNRDDDL